MKKFAIIVDDKRVFFFIDSEKIANGLISSDKIITKTIPGTVVYLGEVPGIDEGKDYLFYQNSSVKFVNINREDNVSVLSFPEEQLFLPDLVYLLMCMFANIFQAENKYFLQASVVHYNESESSIMFIGEPNSGKTTMLSKLLLSGNWSLVSNDNVLVGMEENSFSTFAGTKSVQMRLGAMNLFFPGLSEQVELPPDIESRDEWDVKVYIDDFLQSLHIGKVDISPVTDIYLINTGKSNTMSIRDREDIDQLLLLYDAFTRQIRGSRHVLTGFGYPMPSFENERYAQCRLALVQQVLQAVNIHDLRGDVDEATLMLRKNHEHRRDHEK